MSLVGEVVPLHRQPEQEQSSQFELLEPQVNMLKALEEARELGAKSGYADAATGIGKTYAAAHDVKKILDEKPNGRVLYLCHKGEILRQARKTFGEVLDVKSHGNIFGGQFEDQEQIVYATFQSMTGKLGGGKAYEGFSRDEFDYVIVDESHHGPAPTYEPVINHFRPDFLLGLTATSERTDEKDIGDIFGSKLFEYRLETAIADGVLAHPDYRLNIEQKDTLDQARTVGRVALGKINRQLDHVRLNSQTQEQIAQQVQETMAEHDDPRTVIYCPNIEYANDFAKLIPGAVALHSKLNSKEQDEERLEQFREGKIKTLTVVDLLNEGVDVPEINNLVFLRGTTSKTVFLQQLGRGLRRIPGKEKVTVLDFAASWERIKLIADLYKEVEDIHEDPTRREKSTTSNSPRFRREIKPYNFTFSQEALNAIEVLESIPRSQKKNEPTEGNRKRSHREADDLVKNMLNIDNLPNQRITTIEWEQFARRLSAGDDSVKNEIIMRRLRVAMTSAQKALDAKQAASNLTLDDHFQNYMEHVRIALDDAKNPIIGKDLREQLGWIEMKLHRDAADQGEVIRTPQHVNETINRIQRVRLKIEKKNGGREATPEEIAEATGLDPKDIKNKYREIIERQDHGLAQLEATEGIAGSGSREVFNETNSAIREEILDTLLESLLHRQRRMLELRYGLRRVEPMTLDSIGRLLGVSREYIRATIETSTLRNLKSKKEAQPLREGLYDASEEHYNTYGDKISTTNFITDAQRRNYEHLLARIAKEEDPKRRKIIDDLIRTFHSDLHSKTMYEQRRERELELRRQQHR